MDYRHHNMDYRHQFWIIAKINGRYRTLAVQGLQNCGDAGTIHACWRLLKIFGASTNQKLLRRDLEHAARQDQGWWESTNTPSSLVPFPFVETCLSLGASFDSRLQPYPYVYPADPYKLSITPMELLMHNQSGSTIIDITDPRQLRYCFMFYPSPRHDPVEQKIMEEVPVERNLPEDEDDVYDEDDEDDEEFLRCRPLIAETYLTWPWLEDNEFDPYVDLSPWDLITPDALRDLWPQVPWPHQDDTTPAAGQSQQTQHLNQYDHEQATSVPSTVAPISLDILRQLLDDNRSEGDLADMFERTPGFSEQLSQALVRLGLQALQLPDPMTLLQHAIRRGRETLDFSPFPWLPEAVLSQLIEAMAADNNIHNTVTSVDLSGHGSVNPAAVARLLELYPNITTLALVHTSSTLPLSDLSKVLTGKSGIELHHSELFSAALIALEIRGGDDEPFWGRLASVPNYAAPTGTVDQVLFLSTIKVIPKKDHPLRLEGGGLRWSELLSRDNHDHLRIGHRESLFHTSIPLQDAFLNPSRLADWLPRLLWYFATNSATNDRRSSRCGHASLGCALALAMDTENDWRVGPIPATAAIRPWTGDMFCRYPLCSPAFVHGGWTLLVVAEDEPGSRWYTRRCKALRYTLATRDAHTGALVACSPSEFYARATGRRPDGEMEGYVPKPVKDLVEECKHDEIAEIAGPFFEKREQLARTTEQRG